MPEDNIPDCPGCDAVGTLTRDRQSEWFECSCCNWQVRIVAGVIRAVRPC